MKVVSHSFESTPGYQFGFTALYMQLLGASQRSNHKDFDTNAQAQLECAIIDEWAIILFRYCRRHPRSGLRMYAMLSHAEDHLWMMLAREHGCSGTPEAIQRLRKWRNWAATIPPL